MKAKQKDRQTITLAHIWEARKRIETVVHKTPLIQSPILSELTHSSVYLKLENLQEIGAFKVRGAANTILSLTPEQQKKGVTTFSTGNHGLAVAYVAKQLGIKAVICISKRVPKAKVEAIQRLGAQLEIYGNSQDQAGERCLQLVQEQGLSLIKPFDDPHVIAGQGTIGLELLEALPEIDTVVIPLSGGGLFAGIALALKETNPAIQLIGVSMERAAVMYESLKAGKPIELEEEDTLADSLLGGIGLDNQYTFELVQKYIDHLILVPEKSIATGMAFMFEKHRMAIEGASATGIGALLDLRVKAGKHIVSIISGNNVDIPLFLQAIKNYIGN